MLSTARIFCCYHPDFVEDVNEEKGYRVLNTGKWVVEWDELEKADRKLAFFKTMYLHDHFSKKFDTLEEAEKFEKELRRNQNIFD